MEGRVSVKSSEWKATVGYRGEGFMEKLGLKSPGLENCIRFENEE